VCLNILAWNRVQQREYQSRLHGTYSDKTFWDSLTKAKFWLAVCLNLKLETEFKGLYLKNCMWIHVSSRPFRLMHMNGQITIHLDLFYLNTFTLHCITNLASRLARPRTKKFLMQLEYRWNEGRLYGTFLVSPFINAREFFLKSRNQVNTVRNNSLKVGFIAHTPTKLSETVLQKLNIGWQYAQTQSLAWNCI